MCYGAEHFEGHALGGFSMARFRFVGTSRVLMAGMTVALIAATEGCQQILGIEDNVPIREGGANGGGTGGTGSASTSNGSSSGGMGGTATSGTGGMGSGSSTSSTGMGSSSGMASSSSSNGSASSSTSNSSSSSSGGCLSCLEPQGRALLQGTQDEIIRDIAVDSGGNLVIVGTISGTAMFDPDCSTSCPVMSAGNDDIVVAKLDPMGTPLWSMRAGSNSATQIGNSIDVDSTGNIVVGGYFADTITFGAKSCTSNNVATTDVFIAKYDGMSWAWCKNFGDSTGEQLGGIATDSAGNIFAVGHFSGSITFPNCATLMSMGANDVFLAKLDPNGICVWAQRFGDTSDQTASGIVIDSTGAPIIVGQCAGLVNFGGAGLNCQTNSDVFVAKFQADGMHAWSKNFGVTGDTAIVDGKAIAIDGTSGDVVITGRYKGAIDFLTPEMVPLSNAGLSDTYVVKLNGANGSALWSRQFGAAKDQIPTSIVVDGLGRIYVTGSLFGSVTFASTMLTSPASMTDDIFLIGYDSAGAPSCGANFGDIAGQAGTALAVGTNGDLILGATYRGPVDLKCTTMASYVGGIDSLIARIKP